MLVLKTLELEFYIYIGIMQFVLLALFWKFSNLVQKLCVSVYQAAELLASCLVHVLLNVPLLKSKAYHSYESESEGCFSLTGSV